MTQALNLSQFCGDDDEYNDIPDSCWSVIFLSCKMDDLIFNVASTEYITNNTINDNDEYYYRKYRTDSMEVLGNKSKIKRIYFRELCVKSFPDIAYNYFISI